jgi:hypothetical protein
MTRASSLHALVAVCVLAGCSKSGPETGAAPAAAPAKDSTMAADKMKDTTGMAMDSSKMKMDSTKTMTDSTKMMPDTTSMMKDTTMQMPADSAKK